MQAMQAMREAKRDPETAETAETEREGQAGQEPLRRCLNCGEMDLQSVIEGAGQCSRCQDYEMLNDLLL